MSKVKSKKNLSSDEVKCFFWREDTQRVGLVFNRVTKKEFFLNYEISLGFEGTPEEHGINDGCVLPPRIAEFFQSLLEKEGYMGQVEFIPVKDEDIQDVFGEEEGDASSKGIH